MKTQAVSWSVAFVAVAMAVASCGPEDEVELTSSELRAGTEPYIVVLDEAFAGDPEEVARAIPVTPRHVYRRALQGFSARLKPGQYRRLARHPAVRFIEADRMLYLYAQQPSTGLGRTHALLNRTARIDGQADPLDVDVAIIDTGIDVQHPDLQVVDGVAFRGLNSTGSTDPADYDDNHGHGTHVAGIVAALDNTGGVVGVAPGARLHAVAVFEPRGGGAYTSNIVKGVDWVTARGDIEVVNMSLGGTGADQQHDACSQIVNDSMHKAICNSVAAGITYVVAAGNEGDDAAHHTPGAYDEVITVSALADFNGAPGGGFADSYAFQDCTEAVDDSFACFSNYGPDVDIMAPGVGILSTYSIPDAAYKKFTPGYAWMSGTSMAAPFVAGAAALYKARHPGASPDQVKQALLADFAEPCPAGPGGGCLDDPDGIAEPLLYLGVVDEPFERYTSEQAPSDLPLEKDGLGYAKVVGAAGAKSLQTGVAEPGHSTGAFDYATTDLCLHASSSSGYLSARFKVRFNSLASWDSFIMSDGSGSWLYWWWINSSGQVFDEYELGRVQPGTWHEIVLEVDRASGARVSIGGDAIADPVTSPLATWPASTEPLNCLRLLANGSNHPHYFEIDDLFMRARPR